MTTSRNKKKTWCITSWWFELTHHRFEEILGVPLRWCLLLGLLGLSWLRRGRWGSIFGRGWQWTISVLVLRGIGNNNQAVTLWHHRPRWNWLFKRLITLRQLLRCLRLWFLVARRRTVWLSATCWTTFLDLLEVATQRVTSWCLNDWWWLAGNLRLFFLILTARIMIIFTFLLLLALLASIDVILQLNANLSLGRLLLDERCFEKLLRVRSLVIILHQDSVDESVELLRPFLWLEPWRRIARNEKQSSHWV